MELWLLHWVYIDLMAPKTKYICNNNFTGLKSSRQQNEQPLVVMGLSVRLHRLLQLARCLCHVAVRMLIAAPHERIPLSFHIWTILNNGHLPQFCVCVLICFNSIPFEMKLENSHVSIHFIHFIHLDFIYLLFHSIICVCTKQNCPHTEEERKKKLNAQNQHRLAIRIMISFLWIVNATDLDGFNSKNNFQWWWCWFSSRSKIIIFIAINTFEANHILWNALIFGKIVKRRF